MDTEYMDVETCIGLDSQVECSQVLETRIGLGSQAECSQVPDNCDADNLKEATGDGVITPQIGMEFITQEEAYEFYNRYAFHTGFGVRRGSSHKSVGNLVRSRTFVCDKEGKKNIKISEENANKEVVCKRPTRVCCKVRMVIVLSNSETWKISKFVEQHRNHELTSPTKVSKHRSHKILHRQPRVRRLITDLHNEGLANSHIAKVVGVLEPSAHDSVTSQQIHDQLRIERKNNMGQNCAKVIRHFHNKLVDDPDFFFAIEVTDDLTVRSVFWADGRSRMSYQKFSDVIVFDVTYRTNCFSLPFAPFTGINHHRQSSLFGCALLADETEETFVWLFQKWLECMWDKAPGAIITDQDAAMGNAIARIFPHTRHRYCDWHLGKIIAEHMLHLKTIHGMEFETYFKRVRYSESIHEAEKYWNKLMARYKLGDRSWLPKLWERRERWIPCYLNETFFTGARTSQRAESINSFFDTFVNAKTSLNEFVVQYDKAVASRRAAEENEDFMTINSHPVLSTKWQVEEQAGRCYTKAIFDIFSKELKDGIIYWNEKVCKEGNIVTYIVGPTISDKSKWRTVTYNDSNGDDVVVSCQCKHFETVGLLCRHALNILWKKHVVKIPDRYILNRWTIDARHRVSTYACGAVGSALEMDREICRNLRYKCNLALQEAYRSDVFCKKFDMLVSNALVEIDSRNKDIQVMESNAQSKEINQVGSSIGSSAQSNRNMDLFPEITIHDPVGPAKTKGRPRIATRIRSGLEESQEETQKKQRTCGFCGEKGHYITGCKQAKATRERQREQANRTFEQGLSSQPLTPSQPPGPSQQGSPV